MEMRGGCDQLIDVPNHIGGKELQSIDGEWILNYAPSTGEIISRIPKSNIQDVNNAVKVAKEAGEGWGLLSKNERADWLDRIADSLERRFDEIASLESQKSSLIAERDARPTQASYDTVVAERDAKLTLDEVKDLRAGSTMIAVENGTATLSMEVEESDDLEIWTSGGTTNLKLSLTAIN